MILGTMDLMPIGAKELNHHDRSSTREPRQPLLHFPLSERDSVTLILTYSGARDNQSISRKQIGLKGCRETATGTGIGCNPHPATLGYSED